MQALGVFVGGSAVVVMTLVIGFFVLAGLSLGGGGWGLIEAAFMYPLYAALILSIAATLGGAVARTPSTLKWSRVFLFVALSMFPLHFWLISKAEGERRLREGVEFRLTTAHPVRDAQTNKITAIEVGGILTVRRGAPMVFQVWREHFPHSAFPTPPPSSRIGKGVEFWGTRSLPDLYGHPTEFEVTENGVETPFSLTLVPNIPKDGGICDRDDPVSYESAGNVYFHTIRKTLFSPRRKIAIGRSIDGSSRGELGQLQFRCTDFFGMRPSHFP